MFFQYGMVVLPLPESRKSNLSESVSTKTTEEQRESESVSHKLARFVSVQYINET